MKKSLFLVAIVCIVFAGFSQVTLDYTVKPKVEPKGQFIKGLSPSSARFLCQLRTAESTRDRAAKESLYTKLQHDYNIVRGMVSATLELAEGKTSEDLTPYGITVNSARGGIVTAQISVSRFAELAESGLCISINVGEKQHLMMDNARQNLGVDQIHAGMNLPQGYDGSGVVVGVIDIGFEFCHPAFYDATGTTLRVKKVWNQKDSTGTAPSGFSYGSEYTTEAQMMAAKTDDTAQSHGTHVTSIAAGCGAPYGDGATYKGIAPGSDIVLVPAKLDAPNIIDAINYIHSYAMSVSKPCVINMSFGSMTGPHDGTSDKDRYLYALMEEHPDSLVLVTSAANSGNDPVHLEKHFSATDTLVTSQLVYDLMQREDGELDIWGDHNYNIALSLVSADLAEQVDFSGFFPTGSDTSIVVNLYTNTNDSLTCHIEMLQLDPFNHRYNVNIKIDTIPILHQLILSIRCDTTATIHAWCDNMTFQSSTLVSGTVTGDSHYSIGGFGANSDAVVSVGSYATRLGYTTYSGANVSGSANQEMGDISYFSSVGPTIDGRVKPDIAAPGSVIVAACNRFDSHEGGSYGAYDTIVWNGTAEKYCTMSGTSMSSPMVTGIVALWMQHNSSLGIDSARAILHRTAHNDRYTGNCVTTPNNTWGHGKVNAFGGLPATSTMWLLNAYEAQDGYGCVNGGGVVTGGAHTLTAVPKANYAFLGWEDGNTDNPRTVNVTCDTTFIANFAPLSYEDCDTIVDFPWTAEFDEAFSCWKLIDADGDGANWSKGATSLTSLIVGLDAFNTDNWLISPALQINQRLKANITTQCFNVMGSQDCSILISTSGSEMSDYTTVLESHTFTATEDYVFSVPLDDYQGQIVSIAVRHHNCSSMLASLMLYDFAIEVVQDSVSVPSYEENPDYTIATHGLQLQITGAENRSLEIYDLTGRLVMNSRIADGTYSLPSSGVYILRVSGLKSRKIVVIR